jgi:hypothetical protein
LRATCSYLFVLAFLSQISNSNVSMKNIYEHTYTRKNNTTMML